MTSNPAITRALGYPYPAPSGDFIFQGGGVEAYDEGVSLENRTPVLAVGSNRAPEQLRRKFGDIALVPVTVASLRDLDVVYSAHMASYGSIPATLAPSPGTRVAVSLTWLTPDQLNRMHETEAIGVNYDYGVARDLEIDMGAGRPAVPIGCYLGRRGALALDGRPVALAEVEAVDRVFGSARQSETLARVHADQGRGEPFEAWLSALIADRDRRARLTTCLSRKAFPIDLAAFTRT